MHTSGHRLRVYCRNDENSPRGTHFVLFNLDPRIVKLTFCRDFRVVPEDDYYKAAVHDPVEAVPDQKVVSNWVLSDQIVVSDQTVALDQKVGPDCTNS